jgi:DNA modification methylase
MKVANIKLEASVSSWYLGKPNLPGGIVKNDIETIVMLRKPGGYRKPTAEMEAASFIGTEDYRRLFRPVWDDIRGESGRRWKHPAPYPLELSNRLIRMFSFVGDTVLDPFGGSGTTAISALDWGRDSISIEIVPEYVETIERRLSTLYPAATVERTTAKPFVDNSALARPRWRTTVRRRCAPPP